MNGEKDGATGNFGKLRNIKLQYVVTRQILGPFDKGSKPFCRRFVKYFTIARYRANVQDSFTLGINFRIYKND